MVEMIVEIIFNLSILPIDNTFGILLNLIYKMLM